MALSPGTRLGPYEILGLIGAGGMGEVYRGRDTRLDRTVAIKILPGDFALDPERRARFELEAKTIAGLAHPHICTLHDVGEVAGSMFLVMEHLEGVTLAEKLRAGPLPVDEVLATGAEIADALAVAHRRGVVHRDLKPANVMLTATGAKLLDFGLAKLVSTGDDAGPAHGTATTQPALLTGRGVIAGTAAYMSPEQANGAEIDSRSDIFAFGAVLYEMVTGTAAFARESTLSSLTAVLRDTPAPVSHSVRGAPKELDRVIAMCLQKDPARRFQHAGDVKVLLEQVREDPGTRARSGTRSALVVMVLLAAVAAGVAVAIRYADRPTTSTQVAELDQTGFTFDDGMTMYPAMSTDGKLAAFASDRSGEGHLDIYVQQSAGAPAVRRTTHPADDLTPSFSPDGSSIVFRSERDGGGLYVVEALAGTERKVASRGVYPRFSPDGKRIAYVDVPAALLSGAGEALSVVSADGGMPTRLDPDFVAGGDPGFSWSPDGKYVLSRGYKKSTRRVDVYAVPADGGPAFPIGLQDIARPFRGALFYVCTWIPAGIVYAVSGRSEGSSLFIVPPPGSDLHVTGQPRLLLSTRGMLFGAAASDAGLLLYAVLDWTPNYWMVSLDPRQRRTLGSPAKITSDTMMKLDAAVSRDGVKMGYVSLRSRRDQKIDLHIRDLRTGTETRTPLSGRFSANFGLRLSADGSLVAFRDWDGQRWMTYIAQADGSAREPLCDNCLLSHFAPEPRTVYLWLKGTLVRRAIDSRQDTGLLEIPSERLSDATVSPDGQWIAVLLENSDRTAEIGIGSLKRLPVRERDLAVVASDARLLGSPRWSIDGDVLYYLSQSDGFVCIWGQQLDARTRQAAGAPFPVLHQHEARLGRFGPRDIFSFEVAAQRLLFNLTDTRGNLWTASLTSGREPR